MVTIIQDIWSGITSSPLQNALSEMVSGAGDLVTDLLPVGIELMFVLAMPRIVRRVINTFV